MRITEELKTVVAKNLTQLRKNAGITQADLAERLNYTDKAVSKWERGESLPDLVTVKQVADLFGVSVDYLMTEDHGEELTAAKQKKNHTLRNRGLITGICVLGVWFIATLAFVNIDLFVATEKYHWLSFVYAVPVSVIVWLVLNSIWFNRKRNYLIISLLLWSVLASLYLTGLAFGKNIWLIYVLGIPSQAIVLLCSFIKKSRQKEREPK